MSRTIVLPELRGMPPVKDYVYSSDETNMYIPDNLQCIECDQELASPELYKAHCKKFHLLKCLGCAKTHANGTDAAYHNRTVHRDGSKQAPSIRCPACSFTAVDRHSWCNHFKRHYPEALTTAGDRVMKARRLGTMRRRKIAENALNSQLKASEPPAKRKAADSSSEDDDVGDIKDPVVFVREPDDVPLADSGVGEHAADQQQSDGQEQEAPRRGDGRRVEFINPPHCKRCRVVRDSETIQQHNESFARALDDIAAMQRERTQLDEKIGQLKRDIASQKKMAYIAIAELLLEQE